MKVPAVPNHPEYACDGSDPRCVGGHLGWEGRASTDPDRIRRAWERRAWGIGIACGPSGLVVIDLDIAKAGRRSGYQTLERIEHDHSEALPPTWTVATPSGGEHRYYRQPDGPRLRSTASRVGPGIDTRAWGGYVVAAPTRLPAGSYVVTEPTDVVPLPPWFSQHLTPNHPGAAEPSGQRSTRRRSHRPTTSASPGGERLARYADAAITAQCQRVATAPVTTRNNTLYVSASVLGQLVAAGATTQTEVTERLEAAVAHFIGIEGFTWTEAHRTIASGLNRGLANPRRLPAHLQPQPTQPVLEGTTNR